METLTLSDKTYSLKWINWCCQGENSKIEYPYENPNLILEEDIKQAIQEFRNEFWNYNWDRDIATPQDLNILLTKHFGDKLCEVKDEM